MLVSGMRVSEPCLALEHLCSSKKGALLPETQRSVMGALGVGVRGTAGFIHLPVMGPFFLLFLAKSIRADRPVM